jgi:hypothetical protein
MEGQNDQYCGTEGVYCYLFFDLGKPEIFGSSVFAKDGYVNWKKAKNTFNQHTTCKTRNNARLKHDDFMNQRTNVARKIDVISKEEEKRYEIRLNSSLDVARFFIMQCVDWYKDKVEIVKNAYDKGAIC